MAIDLRDPAEESWFGRARGTSSPTRDPPSARAVPTLFAAPGDPRRRRLAGAAFGAAAARRSFIDRGEGAYLIDVDGNRYVDLVQSWGALLFGHARPEIVEAATRAAAEGTSFGAPTAGEVELAERIVDAVPGIDRCAW